MVTLAQGHISLIVGDFVRNSFQDKHINEYALISTLEQDNLSTDLLLMLSKTF